MKVRPPRKRARRRGGPTQPVVIRGQARQGAFIAIGLALSLILTAAGSMVAGELLSLEWWVAFYVGGTAAAYPIDRRFIRVSLTLDDDGVTARSPFKRIRRVRWRDVEQFGVWHSGNEIVWISVRLAEHARPKAGKFRRGWQRLNEALGARWHVVLPVPEGHHEDEILAQLRSFRTEHGGDDGFDRSDPPRGEWVVAAWSFMIAAAGLSALVRLLF